MNEEKRSALESVQNRRNAMLLLGFRRSSRTPPLSPDDQTGLSELDRKCRETETGTVSLSLSLSIPALLTLERLLRTVKSGDVTDSDLRKLYARLSRSRSLSVEDLIVQSIFATSAYANMENLDITTTFTPSSGVGTSPTDGS